jgi:hypothetical protein
VRTLFGKVFGLGNAVMAVPAIKALHHIGCELDVLVGSTRDDVGALEVLRSLKTHYRCIKNIWVDRAQPVEDPMYKMAIMSIPFDGRWYNGTHYHAFQTMDGRTRPDPSTTGLVSWKKHEVEYQMENARVMGYNHVTPDCSFMPKWLPPPNAKFRIYLGVGYKKDAVGFWKVKHWGNENYAELCKRILAEIPDCEIVTTGDMADIQLSIMPIMKMVDDLRLQLIPTNLIHSLEVVNSCHMYVGNDTGMMHVAAAQDKKVVGIFKMWNSSVKAHPWCQEYRVVEGIDTPITVEEVFTKIKELL